MKADNPINPSRQNLIAELKNCCRTTRLHIEKYERTGDPAHAGQLSILHSCQGQLDEIGAILSEKPANIILAWRLLHWVHGQLILVMSRQELAALGRKLLDDLKLVALPESVRSGYVTDLTEKLKELEGQQHLNSQALAATAQLFKMILNTINDFVDDLFWDIWVRRYFAFIYSALLVIAGITFLLFNFRGPLCLSLFDIMVIGAAGGVTSGIITSDQEYMSKGHFWLPTFYYMTVRPTIGVVASVVMFWMLQSHYLIQVDPPLHDCCTDICGISGSANKAPSSAAGSVSAQFAKVSSSQPVREKVDSSIVMLKTVEGGQIYLYMLLLFFAGFSGDKVLKGVSCRVTTRLFAEAEKTKEAR